MANFETVEVTTDLLILRWRYGRLRRCGRGLLLGQEKRPEGHRWWTRPPWTVPARWPWASRPSTSTSALTSGENTV